MKNIFFVAFVALLSTLLTSCGGSDSTTQLPPAATGPVSVTMEGTEGTAHTITFTAPSAWTAEVHQTGTWLEAKPMSGPAGENQITLTARSANMGLTSRTATVDIYFDGSQAYSVKVEQTSATTEGIKVSGNINEGVMTLASDARGTKFADTIFVTSEKQWSLAVEAAAQNILSFDQQVVATDGAEKTTQVIVAADYAKFPEVAFSGKFSIKTADGVVIPVTVNAQAQAAVYETAAVMQGQTERTSYNLLDTVQRGVFQASFYVESNVRWTLKDAPDWIEIAEASMTNIKKDGTINKNRHAINVKLKADKLSKDSKNGSVKFVDDRGKNLKVVNIIFAGVGEDYVDYKMSWPASDINGNPWAFEAHESTVQAEGPANRRRISMDFTVVSSGNYSSIDAAPFHLIMVDGTNGIAHKKEFHWATLKIGDPVEQTTTANGMYQKQILIVANERGDADDVNKVTDPTHERIAFIYIVPKSVSFNDLWNADGSLKDAYADDLVMISQKNDPFADYKFALQGVADGSTVTIAPAGETKTYDVVAGSYSKCDYTIQVNNGDGEWAATSDCTITPTSDEHDNVTKLTIVFKENKRKYDSFKKQWVGSDRKFRIQFKAFIADGESQGEGEESSSSQGVSKVIYTIYADQKVLAEE